MKNIKKISFKLASILALCAWSNQAFGMLRRGITRMMPQAIKTTFNIQTFDPSNQKHYQQILNLLTKDKEFLLDPGENPIEVMNNYVNGMKTSTYDATNPYSELCIRIVLANNPNDPNNSDVAGFLTFGADQYKVLSRTLAIDPAYRGQGLAKQLLKDLESETKKKNLNLIATCMYSHNEPILKLTKELGYKLYEQDPTPTFSKINTRTGEKLDVYTGIYTKKL